MPDRAVTTARRGTLTRETARRAVVDELRIGESMCAYAAARVSDGMSPEQARRAVIEVAGELAELSAALRRLARLAPLDPAGRRRLVAELAASGMSQQRIAEQLGVAKRTVWGDLRARR